MAMYWANFIKNIIQIFRGFPFPITLWARLHIAITYIRIKVKEVVLVKLFKFSPKKETLFYPTLTMEFFAYTQFVSLFEDIFINHQYYHPILHKKNVTVVDGGAHMGMFSAYCNWINETVRIVAYEADPVMNSLCNKNAVSNSWKKTKCINAALSGKKGKRWFYFDQEFPGSFMSSISKERGLGGKVTVPCLPLSPLLRKRKLDYIKLDIEGAEYEVLQNLAQKRLLMKVDVFTVEFHHNIEKIERLSKALKDLSTHGFIFSFDAKKPSKLFAFQDILVYAEKTGCAESVNRPPTRRVSDPRI